MQRILVIQTAFIGDVVLATAMLESLHRTYPEATIDMLVRKGNEGLLRNHPFLSEILVWEKQTQKYRSLFQLLKKIRQKKYDWVINVQRYAATGLLTAFSGAARKTGFDKNPFSFLFTETIKHEFSRDKEWHEVVRNHVLIASATGPLPGKPRLYPTEADFASVKNFQSQPYICLAPASVWFTKQFPADQWVALLNRLPDHIPVYLLGAPGDVLLGDTIVHNTTHPQVMNLAGKLNLLASAALMEKAEMNYVNDSAPMHFASAMNAPVTAVYCSTIPAFGYGPLSDTRFVIETPITLDCRPCGLHGHAACPRGHFNCARQITTEQLLSVLPASANTN